MKAKTDGKFPSVFVLSGQDPDSDQERHHKKKQPLTQSPVMIRRRPFDGQREKPSGRPSAIGQSEKQLQSPGTRQQPAPRRQEESCRQQQIGTDHLHAAAPHQPSIIRPSAPIGPCGGIEPISRKGMHEKSNEEQNSCRKKPSVHIVYNLRYNDSGSQRRSQATSRQRRVTTAIRRPRNTARNV